MKYGSVCSGIEAATVAWDALGWTPVFFSEIEPFPCAVLAHHYPTVPNHGDMTKFKEWPDADIDVLVGGTPCQSFSVAGLRQGLRDPRGNLMLTYLAIADRYRPRWVVWENVPGVLSSHGGRDFGAFLSGLADLGYGWAYRVLDAQYFGLAQRRKRVFVVGCAGDWSAAAEVLSLSPRVPWNPAPRRESREGVAGTLKDCSGNRGWSSSVDTADTHLQVTHALKADGFDASEDGTGRGTPLIPTGTRFAERERECGCLMSLAPSPMDRTTAAGSTARTPTQDELSRCLNAGGMGRQDWETETLVIHDDRI